MKNCLYSKLLASVNDNTLPTLGLLVVRATSTGSVNISFNTNEAQTILVKSPTGTTLQTVNVPASGSNVNITQDCSSYNYVDYIIPNKYAVTRIVGMVTSPASSDAQYNIVNGTPDYMNNISVYALGYTFPSNPIELSSITSFSTSAGTNIINDITCLSNLLAITSFSDGNSAKGVLKGDLKALVENWCKNGRESDTMTMHLNHSTNNLYWGTTRLVTLGTTRSLSITFSATGCVVTKTAGTMPFATATYTKSTDSWSTT